MRVLLFLGLCACAASTVQAPGGSVAIGGTWITVETDRFTMATDLAPALAKNVLDRIDARVVDPFMSEGLRRLLPPLERERLIVFADRPESVPVGIYGTAYVYEPFDDISEMQGWYLDRVFAQVKKPVPFWLRAALRHYLDSTRLQGDDLMLAPIVIDPEEVPSAEGLLGTTDEYTLGFYDVFTTYAAGADLLLRRLLAQPALRQMHLPSLEGATLPATDSRTQVGVATETVKIGNRVTRNPAGGGNVMTPEQRAELTATLESRVTSQPKRQKGQPRLPRLDSKTLGEVQGKRGEIRVKLRVDRSGKVSGAYVERSQIPELDSVVRDHALSWRFEPRADTAEYVQPWYFDFTAPQ